MERVQAVIRAVEPHDSVERYTALGVDVVEGTAKIVSPWEVEIVRTDGEKQRLSMRAIVIAANNIVFSSSGLWSLNDSFKYSGKR